MTFNFKPDEKIQTPGNQVHSNFVDGKETIMAELDP